MDLGVVGDVVAVVAQRRGIKRQQPQRRDAQVLQIVELLRQAAKVADAVVVAVVERADVQLIDDRVLVPLRIDVEMRFRWSDVEPDGAGLLRHREQVVLRILRVVRGSTRTPRGRESTNSAYPAAACRVHHSGDPRSTTRAATRVPAGGATSGSATGRQSRSRPRFTSTRRSSPASPKYRSKNASPASTAPSMRSARCAANTGSSRRKRSRSRCRR